MKCKLCKQNISKKKDNLGNPIQEFITLQFRKTLGYKKDKDHFIHWKCYSKHADPSVIRPIVEFVRNFNPRLFYQTPKDLIKIIKDFNGSLIIGE